MTPKHNTQSVDIPANAELAIYAESSENDGGNMYSCGRAVRFQSVEGGHYVLHFTPHGSVHRAICEMSLLETKDGKDIPVASAHVAVMERAGFWKGGGLKFCVP